MLLGLNKMHKLSKNEDMTKPSSEHPVHKITICTVGLYDDKVWEDFYRDLTRIVQTWDRDIFTHDFIPPSSSLMVGGTHVLKSHSIGFFKHVCQEVNKLLKTNPQYKYKIIGNEVIMPTATQNRSHDQKSQKHTGGQ